MAAQARSKPKKDVAEKFCVDANFYMDHFKIILFAPTSKCLIE